MAVALGGSSSFGKNVIDVGPAQQQNRIIHSEFTAAEEIQPGTVVSVVDGKITKGIRGRAYVLDVDFLRGATARESLAAGDRGSVIHTRRGLFLNLVQAPGIAIAKHAELYVNEAGQVTNVKPKDGAAQVFANAAESITTPDGSTKLIAAELA